MINLIRANLYRVSKGKTYKKCWYTLLLFFIFVMLVTAGGSGSFEVISTQGPNGERYGYVFSAQAVQGNYTQLVQPVLGFTGIVIIVMLFIVSEVCVTPYQTGMIRMSVANGYDRVRIYMANLISGSLVVLGLGIGIMSIATLVWGVFFSSRGSLSGVQVIQIIKVMGLWAILIIALVSIWTLVGTWVKEKVVVITIGILIYGFCMMIFLMMLKNTQMLGWMPGAILLQLCNHPMAYENFGQSTACALLVIVSTTAVGCYLSCKQDVK